MTRVRVSVTAEDIAQGTPYHSWGCPIAIAMTRALGHPVGVDEKWCWFVEKEGDVRHLHGLPEAVQAFVRAYDQQQPVAPFSFTVFTVTAEEH